MAEAGIYEIVNLVNGKRYIGSAINLKARWNDHRHRLRKRKHHSVALQRAWDKYGEGAFCFRPRERCCPGDLIAREQLAIDAVSPEYNMAPIAGSTLGFKHSADARQKISEWGKGRRLSPEHAAAISRGKRGRSRPDMIGNQWGRRKQTEAERALNSSSKKGKAKSAAARANIAAAAATPEMRARRSEFMKVVWARRKAASP